VDVRPLEGPARATTLVAALVVSACGRSDVTGPAAEAPTGAVIVEVRTTGEDLDPDGYTLDIDDRSEPIDVNGSVRLADLTPGMVSVELRDAAANCAVVGSNPRLVSVVAGATVETTFEATCAWTLRNKIVFTSSRVGGHVLFAMNEDGSDPRRITRRGDVADVRPDISPDAGLIAFQRDTPIDERGIYTVEPDGSEETRLTAADADAPDWSPDGTRIAFRMGDYIFTMNADGTGLTQLTSDPLRSLSPDWSPDGSRIVLHGVAESNVDIYVMNADGTGLERLTSSSAEDREPVFSPDGSTIVFSSDRDGNRELYTMASDGGALTRLTDDPGLDFEPAWSPDGSKVVFTNTGTASFEIFQLELATGRLVNLTNHPDVDRYAMWGPR